MQDLARLLFVLEAKQANESDPWKTELVQLVCEKLRGPLSQLAGPAGFGSLMSRALALAKTKSPELDAVQVSADGNLVGFDNIRQGSESLGVTTSDCHGVTIVAELLDLLITFIGEPLTMTILRDTWPGESFDTTHQSPEGKI